VLGPHRRSLRGRSFTVPTRSGLVVTICGSDVRQARGRERLRALKAALDVLRDLRNEIRLLVDHGGVTGDSYRATWTTGTPAERFSVHRPAGRRVRR